jgi:dephospho-CoA kinase
MVIGLTGPNASGKGEAVDYLKSKGFKSISLSDILREEARHRGIEISRENLIKLGNEMRKEKGPSILADIAIKSIGGKDNYIIDSIRNPDEIRAIRKIKGFRLIGIDAPVEIRFKRCCNRNRPGDSKTLDEFIEKEKKENILEQANQQLKNCIKLADKIIINDSNLENFYKKIDETINEIQKAGVG